MLQKDTEYASERKPFCQIRAKRKASWSLKKGCALNILMENVYYFLPLTQTWTLKQIVWFQSLCCTAQLFCVMNLSDRWPPMVSLGNIFSEVKNKYFKSNCSAVLFSKPRAQRFKYSFVLTLHASKLLTALGQKFGFACLRKWRLEVNLYIRRIQSPWLPSEITALFVDTATKREKNDVMHGVSEKPLSCWPVHRYIIIISYFP